MIKIKYVGVKQDGERAFKEDTGIEWFPGDVNDVSAEHAAMMLKHPDVFVQVEGEPVALAKAAAPRPRHLPAEDIDDDEANVKEQAVKDAAKTADHAGDGVVAKQEPPKVEAKVEKPKPAAKKPAAKTAKSKAKK